MVPSAIKKIGSVAMRLTWEGNHLSEYSAHYLRSQCHCAACRHELTGEALIQPDQIPADIKITSSQIIGNYALGFEFSDGHRTGIYTFDHLRAMCPCCVEKTSV